MSSTRRARRDHTCDACASLIRAGETYRPLVCRPWDHPDNDGFHTYRMHEDCARALDLAWDAQDHRYDDPITPMQLGWALERSDYEDDPAALAVIDAFLARLNGPCSPSPFNVERATTRLSTLRQPAGTDNAVPQHSPLLAD